MADLPELKGMQSCWSAVTATAEPEALQLALRPGDADYAITAPGHFAARHTVVRLHRVQMQYVEESLPRLMEGAVSPDRLGISLLVQPGPPLFSSGVELGFGDVALHRPDRSFCHRLSGASRWAGISLPPEDWTEVGVAVLGHDMTPPADLTRVAVPELGLARLRRLHAATMQLAQNAPEIIANSHAARGLEAELVVALAESFSTVREQASTRGWRQHAAIMKRFRRYLDDNAGNPLYLQDLCTTIGISRRTLRLCCHETFGMGPMQYLHLRRMVLVRQRLKRPTPDLADVTKIATHFGFWELGRFAVEYRRMFGESPSVTLRKALTS